MYSLVSAPILGFDLARLAQGAQVAHVLRQALAMQPEHLLRLAEITDHSFPQSDRMDTWFDIADAERRQNGMHNIGEQVAAYRAGANSAVLAQILEETSLGHLDGLLRCLRHDVFDWTWKGSPDLQLCDDLYGRGISVASDAIAAHYLGDNLPLDTGETLIAPWQNAQEIVPQALDDFGPFTEDITAMHQQISSFGYEHFARLTDACTAGWGSVKQWSEAVHAATWAVHTTGRFRTTAAAQLATVEIVTQAGISRALLARGAWNIISGAVQVMSVADVANEEITQALRQPFLALIN